MSGTAAFYDGMLQMVHPDRVVPESELSKLPLVEPVYPLTEGLGLNVVRKAAEAALARVPLLPEWQDEAWLRQQQWPSFGAALANLQPWHGRLAHGLKHRRDGHATLFLADSVGVNAG